MAQRAPGDPRCKDCPEPHEPGASRCAACAAKHREAAANRTAERKRRGKCVTCGAKAERGATLCKLHLAYYARRAAG